MNILAPKVRTTVAAPQSVLLQYGVVGVLLVWMGLATGAARVLGAENSWLGTASGYWSDADNWSAGAPANGDTPVFPAAAFHRHNTNDLIIPAFPLMRILGGGYELNGNGMNAERIEAAYPAGATSSVHFNLRAESSLQVAVRTNGSSLTLAGDVFLIGGSLILLGAGDCVVSGAIYGNGGVVKNAANDGDLRLSGLGPNNYQGDTLVLDGTLRLDRYEMLGFIRVGTVAVPGPLSIGTGTGTGASAFVVLERNHQIADSATVWVYGSGQLDLNDSSDTVGSLMLTGGSVVTGTGTLTVVGAVSAGEADGPSIIAGSLGFDDAVTSHSINTFGGARLEIPASIKGTSKLSKYQSGELRLGGSNTFTGALHIENGKVVVAHPQALGAGPAAVTNGTVLSGILLLPRLELDGVTVANEMLTVESDTAVLCGRGVSAWESGVGLTNNADLTVETASGATLALGGILGGNGGLTKTGAGTLRFAGDAPNTFTKTCVVADGILELAKTAGQAAVPSRLQVGDGAGGSGADIVRLLEDNQIADLGEVIVTGSGLLNVNGHAEIIGQLSGAGSVSLGLGTLTISNATNGEFSGTIRGGKSGSSGGDLVKDGPGTWVLSGTNSSTGITRLLGGTLLVNGALAHSGVEISRRATLGGTGTVQGIAFRGLGGVVAPGVTVGVLRAQGTVVLTNGALEIELNGLTPGTGYDQLATDLAPTLGQGSSLRVLPGFAPPVGSTFVILDNRSASKVVGLLGGKAEGEMFAAAGFVFRITYTGGDGNDIELTRVATPAVGDFVAAASESQIALRAHGFPGVSYVAETTSDLTPPVSWRPVGTNAASATGWVEFLDAITPPDSRRFYRVVSP